MITLATSRAKLLRAILCNPADDSARLAYSDALEECECLSRANFIRYGVGEPDIVVTGEWFADCISWAEICWPDSMHSILSLTPRDRRGWSWTWRRGFVDSADCTAAEFVRHAAALFAAHPIERVSLTDAIYAHTNTVDDQRYSFLTVNPETLAPIWGELYHGEPMIGDASEGGLFDAEDLSLQVEQAALRWARRQAGLPEGMPVPQATPEQREKINNRRARRKAEIAIIHRHLTPQVMAASLRDARRAGRLGLPMPPDLMQVELEQLRRSYD